jgi:hypothetical protein
LGAKFEETEKRDGKAVSVRRMMLDSADLKTMSTIVTDNVTRTRRLLVAIKQ